MLEDRSLWHGVRVLLLQNEVAEGLNRAAARLARMRGLPVVLNAAPARALPDDLAGMVDILVVNAIEAEMMGTAPVTDLPSALAAAQTLSARFPAVVVTAGAQGLALVTADESLTLPAEDVQAVSSHGAGDAFTGTLAAELARGADLHQACRAATTAAAAHVAGKG
jgi:ribokinase